MKVEKQIISYEQMDIDITDITLLSIEEYERCMDIVPLIDGRWWLRSPGSNTSRAARVYSNGLVSNYGYDVCNDSSVVRPVVVVRLSESFNPGDKLRFAGHTWTIIAPDMALCDEGVGRCAFRKNLEAPDANVYEASDVKKWLEAWARENGIEPKEVKA